MVKKVSPAAANKARRVKADKAIAAASAKVARVTKAIHQAVAKAIPNAKVSAANVGTGGQPVMLNGLPMVPMSYGGDPVEPKFRAYLVLVVPL